MNEGSNNSPTSPVKCIKRTNGNKKSNELLLVFELSEKSVYVHDILMQWLFKCLNTISHKLYAEEDILGKYELNIISQINDNDIDDNDYNTHEIRLNTIIVAIHIIDERYGLVYDERDLTIPYNSSTSDINVSPQEIMDCLTDEPIFIKKIGVSAVTSDIMMDWWSDMVSIESNSFDVRKTGYILHPTWRKCRGLESNGDWGHIMTCRQSSYIYKWKGTLDEI